MSSERRTRKFINSWAQLSIAMEVVLHAILLVALIALILFAPPFVEMFSEYSAADHQAIAKELLHLNAGKWPLFLFLAVFIGPALLFVKAGVLGLTSSLFGGRGDGRRLLAALGLTYTPALVAVPVNLLLAGRPGVGVLAGLLTLAILVWRLVLDIIAIREVHALSTGRAAAAALVPLGVGVALVTIVFLMSMGLILSILGPIFQSGLPGVG